MQDPHAGCTVRPNKLKWQVWRRERFIAAAAKSRQSCPTLCDPKDGSPPGSHVPGILQARILEWAAISFSSAWKWSCSVVVYCSIKQREWVAHGQNKTKLPSDLGRCFSWTKFGLRAAKCVTLFCLVCGEWTGQLPSKQAPKSLKMVTAVMKLKDACSLEEKLWPT